MVGLMELTTEEDEEVCISFDPLPCVDPGVLRKGIERFGPELITSWKSGPIRDFSDPKYEPVIERLKEDPNAFCHPTATQGENGPIQWHAQAYLDGGGFVVAWGLYKQKKDSSLLVYTIESFTKGTPTPEVAVKRITGAEKEGYAALRTLHLNWWKNYYARSFVSVPDPVIEGYYWKQLYKLGSATRSDGVVLDELGPWPGASAWVRVWNNLNIQIAYLCPLTANRLELCDPFIRLFNNNHQNFADAVPVKYKGNGALTLGRMMDIYGRTGWSKEFGNFAWALHDYWLYCRYSGNETLMKEQLYPLLRGGVAFMLNALELGADGLFHLPNDISPEYPGGPVADSNYNTSLLMWGLDTLLHMNEQFDLQDADAGRWKETRQKLAPLAVDETGLMVGSDRPFAEGHRHYSHLLAGFPLRVLDLENPEDAALYRKSYDHWNSFFPRGKNFFSCSGAAAMAAWLRDGEEAAAQLNYGIKKKLTPNTFFGGAGPAIESALSGMWSVGEMLLQSWTHDPSDYRIRVFPAIPDSWSDVRFEKLRAEGAFLVSACREKGQTQYVEITSEAGMPCRIENPFTNGFETQADREVRCNETSLPNNRSLIEIDLRKGETVRLVRVEETQRDQIVSE